MAKVASNPRDAFGKKAEPSDSHGAEKERVDVPVDDAHNFQGHSQGAASESAACARSRGRKITRLIGGWGGGRLRAQRNRAVGPWMFLIPINAATLINKETSLKGIERAPPPRSLFHARGRN
jgi:hypothetical protein